MRIEAFPARSDNFIATCCCEAHLHLHYRARTAVPEVQAEYKLLGPLFPAAVPSLPLAYNPISVNSTVK
jgi:hypothetical protein